MGIIMQVYRALLTKGQEGVTKKQLHIIIIN